MVGSKGRYDVCDNDAFAVFAHARSTKALTSHLCLEPHSRAIGASCPILRIVRPRGMPRQPQQGRGEPCVHTRISKAQFLNSVDARIAYCIFQHPVFFSRAGANRPDHQALRIGLPAWCPVSPVPSARRKSSTSITCRIPTISTVIYRKTCGAYSHTALCCDRKAPQHPQLCELSTTDLDNVPSHGFPVQIP